MINSLINRNNKITTEIEQIKKQPLQLQQQPFSLPYNPSDYSRQGRFLAMQQNPISKIRNITYEQRQDLADEYGLRDEFETWDRNEQMKEEERKRKR